MAVFAKHHEQVFDGPVDIYIYDIFEETYSITLISLKHYQANSTSSVDISIFYKRYGKHRDARRNEIMSIIIFFTTPNISS